MMVKARGALDAILQLHGLPVELNPRHVGACVLPFQKKVIPFFADLFCHSNKPCAAQMPRVQILGGSERFPKPHFRRLPLTVVVDHQMFVACADENSQKQREACQVGPVRRH